MKYFVEYQQAVSYNESLDDYIYERDLYGGVIEVDDSNILEYEGRRYVYVSHVWDGDNLVSEGSVLKLDDTKLCAALFSDLYFNVSGTAKELALLGLEYGEKDYHIVDDWLSYFYRVELLE